MWPGFDSRTRRHMWVEFVVCARPFSERFFSGYSGFPLSSKTSIRQEDMRFSVNRTAVKPATTYNLLGVHIDEYLNFGEHVVSSVYKKMNRFRKLLSTKTKLSLYSAYILPHFTY